MNGLDFFKTIQFSSDFGGLGCLGSGEAIELLEQGMTIEVSSFYQRLLLNKKSEIDLSLAHIKRFLEYPCHYAYCNRSQITEHGFVD